MMETQYGLLKEQNFQLKNQICELKNAFDLNRDILKIITQQVKSSTPRIKMLYQIINRLTNINNQVMIDTAQLIHEKNKYKIEKQYLKRENQVLIEKIKEYQKEQIYSKQIKISELSLYFKSKIHELENQIKALDQDRIIKEHELQYLVKKIEVYEEQEKKKSIIPTIDRNNSYKKTNSEKNLSIVDSSVKHTKKYQSRKQTINEMKNRKLQKQIIRLRIYNQQIQYRLNIFIKMYQLESQIKKKNGQTVKKQHRKCLEDTYHKELIEIRLLKFAINNLNRQEAEDAEYLFTVTNRNNLTQINNYWQDRPRQNNYLHHSVQKHDIVKMRPKKLNLLSLQHQQSDLQ